MVNDKAAWYLRRKQRRDAILLRRCCARVRCCRVALCGVVFRSIYTHIPGVRCEMDCANTGTWGERLLCGPVPCASAAPAGAGHLHFPTLFRSLPRQSTDCCELCPPAHHGVCPPWPARHRESRSSAHVSRRRICRHNGCTIERSCARAGEHPHPRPDCSDICT